MDKPTICGVFGVTKRKMPTLLHMYPTVFDKTWKNMGTNQIIKLPMSYRKVPKYKKKKKEKNNQGAILWKNKLIFHCTYYW